MKALPCIAVLSLSLIALSACKTTEEKSAYVAPEKVVAPGTMYQPRVEQDAEYIAYVEAVARRRGVKVQWVNAPQKRHVDE